MACRTRNSPAAGASATAALAAGPNGRIELEEPIGGELERVELLRARSRLVPQALAKRSVAEKPPRGVTQRFGRLVRGEEAGVLAHQLAHAARRRGNDRQARRHGLEHGARHAL